MGAENSKQNEANADWKASEQPDQKIRIVNNETMFGTRTEDAGVPREQTTEEKKAVRNAQQEFLRPALTRAAETQTAMSPEDRKVQRAEHLRALAEQSADNPESPPTANLRLEEWAEVGRLKEQILAERRAENGGGRVEVNAASLEADIQAAEKATRRQTPLVEEPTTGFIAGLKRRIFGR